MVRCYILLSPDDGQHQKRGVVAAAVVGAEKYWVPVPDQALLDVKSDDLPC